MDEEQFKASIVKMIINSRTEEALLELSRHYGVDVPRLAVGVYKGKTKGYRAVYSSKDKTILVAKREYMFDPFTIVHEFYHHMRYVGGKHKGTEKHADIFALSFIDAYRKELTR